jgi:histidine phosphotransfer protein HptB
MEFKEMADSLGLEEDEFKELLNLFVETSRAEVEALKSAITRKDAQQAAVPAHSVKGAAGNLGLSEIYETALLVEQKARQDTLDGVWEAVHTLQEQIDRVANAL